MANPEHVEILKQGVEVWNEWRKENERIMPDLSETGLSGANLSAVDLRETDLRNANLSGAILNKASLIQTNLSLANLREANLREANLHRADLYRADLSAAILRGAELRNAYPIGANLRNANLREAKLIMADLSGADLSGADLSAAILWYATCGGTVFADLDLSKVIGLEKVNHEGPSYIDTHTLYNSQGKIPEIFLRGCGVPENLITYLPSLTGGGIEFYSCFIRYNQGDKVFAHRLHDTLQGRGIRCWLNDKLVIPGHDIYAELDHGIQSWDKVLLCCSKTSLTEKGWVDVEINKAFKKEEMLMKEHNQKVLALLPLDLDGHLFSADYNNPKKDEIHSRLAANFNGWEHDNALFEREVERVIKALRTDGGKEPLPERKL